MLHAFAVVSLELMLIRDMYQPPRSCGAAQQPFERDVTLVMNLGNQQVRPVWLEKLSWQALWNWNNHCQRHGIALHSDESEYVQPS